MQPIAGPHFQQAARVHVHGQYRRQERRALLLLLAAYRDANYTPSVAELAARLRVPGKPHEQARRVDHLLDSLEHDGHVVVLRWTGARNRYVLDLDPRRRARGSQRPRRARP